MGNLINNDDPSKPVNSNTPLTSEKKNPNRVLYWLVGVLLVALVLGGAGLYFLQLGASTPTTNTTSETPASTKTADTANTKKAADELSSALTVVSSDITDITNDTSTSNTDDTVPTL